MCKPAVDKRNGLNAASKERSTTIMIEEIVRIGSALVITGLLLRLRVFVLSFDPGKGRKHHHVQNFDC